MKRHPIPPWLILLGLCSLAACERSDHATVCEGVVIDRSSSAFVPNATVVVYEPGRSGGGLGSGYTEKARYQVDANSHFSFKLDSDREDLLLRAFSELGAYTIWQEAFKPRGGRNNKGIQLKVQSPAWIKIHLLDEAPVDTMFVEIGGAPRGYTAYNKRDTVLICDVLGNTSNSVWWRLTPVNRAGTGSATEHRQDVYCPALDTVPLEIRY